MIQLERFRLDLIPREIFGLVRSYSYSFFFESLHVLNFNKYPIKEVPIELPARTSGLSKMSYLDAYVSLQTLITTFFRTRFLRHTLRLGSETKNKSMPLVSQEAKK